MKLFIQKVIFKLKTDKRIAVGAAALVVLLLGVIAFLLLNRSNDTAQPPVKSKPTFTNYLKPASEIKVGDYRYVSPCQVLRLEDVNSIFGNIGGEGYVREDYYDATVAPLTKLDRDVETNCHYVYDDDRRVSLDVKQSFVPLRTDDLQFVLYALGDEKMEEKIKIYERATSNSGEDLKAFVATLKRSVDTYKQQETSRSDEPVDVTNLVFPVDRDLFSFNVVRDNVVYKLDFKSLKDTDDEYKLSDQEIADRLAKSAKGIDLLKRRAADKRLDQSPAPTILGDTEMIGTTKVLESCAILTPQIYQAVIGSPANMQIGRRTASQDIVTERFARNGSPLYPDNECERQGRADPTTTSMQLELNFASTGQELQAVFDKGYKIDGNDKLLQTNAEWSAYFELKNGGYALFRTGAYSGTVTILNTTSAGFGSDIKQSHGTDQQYVQLINAIVDSIKQYTK